MLVVAKSYARSFGPVIVVNLTVRLCNLFTLVCLIISINSAVAQETLESSAIQKAIESTEGLPTPPNDHSAKSSTNQQTRLILVVGAAGQPEFAEQFAAWAEQWSQLAETQNWQLVRIGPSLVDQSSDFERLEKSIQEFAELSSDPIAAAGHRLWLVMIGHGTSSGKNSKFNLVGKDVSSAQLKAWLDGVRCETVVINCASASAPFLVDLSSERRVVITATQASSEVNTTRFGGFLAKSIHDIGTDLDHDLEVSLLEAFLQASRQTQQFYRDEARLTTEHALLDDNGDRAGTAASFYLGALPTTAAVGDKKLDGKRASRIILWSSSASTSWTNQQIIERESIENEIDALRQQKPKLIESDYYDQLERLLIELSALYDQAEKGSAPTTN